MGNQDYLECVIESVSKYGKSVYLSGNQSDYKWGIVHVYLHLCM